MNAVAVTGSKLVFATLATATVAVICMIAAPFMQAQSGRSATLAALMGIGIAASFVGAISGLLVANRRRNVMWILAVAVSLTAMLALLATAVVSFGMN